jgi:ABC-2 type transport system ATP-binding protein
VEVRELIRALGSDGRTTVFLSSHLLAEVAAVCDAVTILRRGQLVATGDVAEVLAMAGGEGQLRVGLRDADEVARAAGVLAEGGFGATPAPPNGLVVAADDGARVNALLGAAGIWASELTAVRPDLERAFLDLTAEGEATA